MTKVRFPITLIAGHEDQTLLVHGLRLVGLEKDIKLFTPP